MAADGESWWKRNKDALQVTAIGGVLVSVLTGGAAVLFESVREWLHEIGAWLWGVFSASVQVPVWVVVLVALLALWRIVALSRRWRRRLLEPDWLEYREDTFDGIVWRWRYTRNGGFYQITPFCPDDDTQLVERPAGGHLVLWCDGCQRIRLSMPMGLRSHQSKVERLAEQKRRTGTWNPDLV